MKNTLEEGKYTTVLDTTLTSCIGYSHKRSLIECVVRCSNARHSYSFRPGARDQYYHGYCVGTDCRGSYASAALILDSDCVSTDTHWQRKCVYEVVYS